eukprot:2872223-Rhodomonas_salina.2
MKILRRCLPVVKRVLLVALMCGCFGTGTFSGDTSAGRHVQPCMLMMRAPKPAQRTGSMQSPRVSFLFASAHMNSALRLRGGGKADFTGNKHRHENNQDVQLTPLPTLPSPSPSNKPSAELDLDLEEDVLEKDSKEGEEDKSSSSQPTQTAPEVETWRDEANKALDEMPSSSIQISEERLADWSHESSSHIDSDGKLSGSSSSQVLSASLPLPLFLPSAPSSLVSCTFSFPACSSLPLLLPPLPLRVSTLHA